MTPRVFQTRICVLWGIVLACHAAVTNKEGLYAARFFLGLAEAGLFPAIMTHLCNWYRSDEMGKPIAWLFGVFNLAGVLGSLLVYGISFLDGKQGLSSWQWYVFSTTSSVHRRGCSLTANRLLTRGRVRSKQGLSH